MLQPKPTPPEQKLGWANTLEISGANNKTKKKIPNFIINDMSFSFALVK
ncbi:MAG: hypothetical protein PVG23_06870 [Nitrosopumilaceae archaeon]|jgi:hypothetical protein